jgi:two-component system sensor histidine kinase KdpD
VKAGDNRIAGTGLGLAICRGLMEAHGGAIVALQGDYGHGACLELTLPIGEPPVPEAPEAVEDGQEEYA